MLLCFLLRLRAGLRRWRLGDRAFAVGGDGVSEPDDRKVEGVPSNRGISSGVTTSTTIASGRGAWEDSRDQKQPHDQGTQVADGRNDKSRTIISL